MDLIPFSKNRYATRLNVVCHSGEHPALGTPELDQIERLLHYDGRAPVVLRMNNRYIVPRAEGGIPANTLAIPEHIAEENRFDLPEKNADLFVISPEMAELYTGGY